jgi:hypothetical protein
MQTLSGQNPRRAVSATRKFTTTIVLVFSLAGLIAGFAFGGLTGTKVHPTPANTGPVKKQTPIVQATVTPTPTATPVDIQLGVPTIIKSSFSETADGATNYTLSAQPIDKTNQSITAADVTCRLWLTTDTSATNTALSANGYAFLKNINGFNQPFPQEAANSMNFTTPSTQLQPCAVSGPTTWTYTLASTVQPGTYYLYVLADWKGKHYNWNSIQIKVIA